MYSHAFAVAYERLRYKRRNLSEVAECDVEECRQFRNWLPNVSRSSGKVAVTLKNILKGCRILGDSYQWDIMDVKALHLAFQFQIQAEMDDMHALVIAAFNSRRRMVFIVFFSAWYGRQGFMPSSELECSGAGCLVYFTSNVFLCTTTIYFV